MPEPTAYLNGRRVPLSQAAVSVFDGGFVQGTTVAEQLRTFGGKLFQLDLHLQRLARSLEIIGVDPGISLEELGRIATELAAENHALLSPGEDLGVTIFITPGIYPAYAAQGAGRGPTVCVHAQPVPLAQIADLYRNGQSLVVTDVMQIPRACWPPELKCRSRMHYYLADRRAGEIEPGARALLLDEEGFITEASTANILLYERDRGLVSPPREKILPGVTVAVVEELANKLGVAFSHRDITPDEAVKADEILLCSTSPCVWSVIRLNGQPISGGQPGPLAAKLRAAWSAMVGVDIDEQARRFAVK